MLIDPLLLALPQLPPLPQLQLKPAPRCLQEIPVAQRLGLVFMHPMDQISPNIHDSMVSGQHILQPLASPAATAPQPLEQFPAAPVAGRPSRSAAPRLPADPGNHPGTTEPVEPCNLQPPVGGQRGSGSQGLFLDVPCYLFFVDFLEALALDTIRPSGNHSINALKPAFVSLKDRGLME